MDTFESLEEKCVSDNVKDGIQISKVSSLFPCSFKSLLNVRLSSARLLINQFLIKKRVFFLLY